MPTDGFGMFARIWVIKSDLFFYQLLIFNKLIFGTTYVLVSIILIVYQHTRIYSLLWLLTLYYQFSFV